MKRCLFLCLLMSFCVHADDQDQLQLLIMQSPVKFIDNDKIAASAHHWVERYVQPLNEAEVKVVARTLQLGRAFSVVDIKMRALIQQILLTVCSLYKVITNGGEDPRISKELEAEIEEFSKLKAFHSFAFHEWQDWTNMLSVSENKKIDAALAAVNESIRKEIESALAQKEWQSLTERIPASAQETIKSLLLLSGLCANASQKEIENNEERLPSEDSVLLFDMIARAAENGCRRSFETIEASSQILMYETLLLEISFSMFDTFLQAMQLP